MALLILLDLRLLRSLEGRFFDFPWASVNLRHYSQDQRFLDLCDEQGILVWEDCPSFCKSKPFLGKREESPNEEDLGIFAGKA